MTAYTLRLFGGPFAGCQWQVRTGDVPPDEVVLNGPDGRVTYRRSATTNYRVAQYTYAEGGSS